MFTIVFHHPSFSVVQELRLHILGVLQRNLRLFLLKTSQLQPWNSTWSMLSVYPPRDEPNNWQYARLYQCIEEPAGRWLKMALSSMLSL